MSGLVASSTISQAEVDDDQQDPQDDAEPGELTWQATRAAIALTPAIGPNSGSDGTARRSVIAPPPGDNADSAGPERRHRAAGSYVA